MIWDYFSKKNILITGASGFLGTAIVHRILCQVPTCHIYVICRGGRTNLQQRWDSYLSPDVSRTMVDSSRMTVLDGDILEINMGLSADDTRHLQSIINIVIHAASSINLGQRLSKISESVIGSTERVADFALECPLDRFIYVSTAYSNTHLYHETSPTTDVVIEESIYKLHGPEKTPVDEWLAVQQRGSSTAYESHNFPWAYAYAKHLTERLITHRFSEHGVVDKLLIIRPSVIGPAQKYPFPGYCVATSTPATMLYGAFLLCPSRFITISTRCMDPESESNIDEVPVDVVVDRLLFHAANKTMGPVHAVSGARARTSFGEYWKAVMAKRYLPWSVKPVWTAEDWHSPVIHPIVRIFTIVGTSFNFQDNKTSQLCEEHGSEQSDDDDLQLFTLPSEFGPNLDLTPRGRHIHEFMQKIGEKNLGAWLILKVFYTDYFAWLSRTPPRREPKLSRL